MDNIDLRCGKVKPAGMWRQSLFYAFSNLHCSIFFSLIDTRVVVRAVKPVFVFVSVSVKKEKQIDCPTIHVASHSVVSSMLSRPVP